MQRRSTGYDARIVPAPTYSPLTTFEKGAVPCLSLSKNILGANGFRGDSALGHMVDGHSTPLEHAGAEFQIEAMEAKKRVRDMDDEDESSTEAQREDGERMAANRKPVFRAAFRAWRHVRQRYGFKKNC
jgi:hypothetical protein